MRGVHFAAGLAVVGSLGAGACGGKSSSNDAVRSGQGGATAGASTGRGGLAGGFGGSGEPSGGGRADEGGEAGEGDAGDGGAGGSAGAVAAAGGIGACSSPPLGMVAWWPGDGTASDIVGDAEGALEGGAGFAKGVVGRAFSLDGVNDFVDLGNSAPLHVSSGDFTIGAWAFFTALSGDMSIVDKMSAGGVNLDGWRLLKQEDNRFWFCFGGGTDNHCVDPVYTVFSQTLAVPSVWFHVAVVKSAKEFSLYVNGKLEDVRRSVPPFVDTNSANLRIGSYVLQGANLNGLVDEVELFDRALSGTEIQAIFDAGGDGNCK